MLEAQKITKSKIEKQKKKHTEKKRKEKLLLVPGIRYKKKYQTVVKLCAIGSFP